MPSKKYLEEVGLFLRENRSNEVNFSKIKTKLDELQQQLAQGELNEGQSSADEIAALHKYAETYQNEQAKGVTTWSAFETFVSHFEKVVLDLLAKAS